MSAPEHPRQAPEGLSSVKLSTTAKGDVQVEVKLYGLSNHTDDVAMAREEAERIFDELRAKYAIGGAA